MTGYKYLCNEQLASKLIGLLAYQQYMQSKGEKVKVDKAIRPIIHRLTNHQNKHQLWSWWGTLKILLLMSAHILRALKMAQDAGYPVELNLNGLKVEYAHTRPYRGNETGRYRNTSCLHEWKVEADYSSAVRLLEPSSGNWNRKKTRWQIETSIIVLFILEREAASGKSSNRWLR